MWYNQKQSSNSFSIRRCLARLSRNQKTTRTSDAYITNPNKPPRNASIGAEVTPKNVKQTTPEMTPDLMASVARPEIPPILPLSVSPVGIVSPTPDTVSYTIVIGIPSAPVVLRERKVVSKHNLERAHQARDIRDSGFAL